MFRMLCACTCRYAFEARLTASSFQRHPREGGDPVTHSAAETEIEATSSGDSSPPCEVSWVPAVHAKHGFAMTLGMKVGQPRRPMQDLETHKEGAARKSELQLLGASGACGRHAGHGRRHGLRR
jgi:hypothetical protein